jgi:uncharacterized protein DUF4261
MNQHESEVTGTPQLVGVMLKTPTFPPPATLLQAIQRRIPRFSAAYPDKPPSEKGIVGIVDGKRCAVLFRDEPKRLTSEDSCIASAWWWQDAWEQLRHHQAAVAITMIDPDKPRHCWGTLAKITAAVIDVSPAVGVSWQPADAVWKPDGFCSAVDAAGDGLPLAVLVSVKVGREEERPRPDGKPGLFGHTWGLAAFNLMEVEVRGFGGRGEDLISTLLGMAVYLVTSGVDIEDGETVGHGTSRDPKFRVRWQQSVLAPEQMVYRLYPESPVA